MHDDAWIFAFRGRALLVRADPGDAEPGGEAIAQLLLAVEARGEALDAGIAAGRPVRAVLLPDDADAPAGAVFRGLRGQHGVLAGFVEPGESLEEAVAREVREEPGIEVEAIRYAGSQAWPCPHSVMIGFTARWVGGELRPQPGEIEEIGWFTAHAVPDFPPRTASPAGCRTTGCASAREDDGGASADAPGRTAASTSRSAGVVVDRNDVRRESVCPPRHVLVRRPRARRRSTDAAATRRRGETTRRRVADRSRRPHRRTSRPPFRSGIRR